MRRDATWRKSSHSGANNECVELAVGPGETAVRDSKLGEPGPVLRFGAGEFGAFLAAVKSGRFDR